MKRVSLLLLAIVTVASIGCKSTKESTAGSVQKAQISTPDQNPQMLASINRTACYGQCPMYKATFMDNGEVLYVGKRFVDNIGTYKTLITSEEVEAIKKEIVAANYFELDSLYPTPITDFPSCITEAQLNGKRKKVVNRRNPPVELKVFEKYLDTLLKDREWEMISDETDYSAELK
jgi:hypothetical protein